MKSIKQRNNWILILIALLPWILGIGGAYVKQDICTSTGEILKWNATTGSFECGTDNTGSGGSPVALDLGNDGIDESIDLVRIATTGDTNNIFIESAVDKLLVDLTKNWPTADIANALAANGANCLAGSYPLGVDATGNVEGCTADDDIPDSDAEVPDALTISGGNISNSIITLDTGVDPTADGQIRWDTITEHIEVGDDGLGTLEFYPGAHTTDTSAATECTAGLYYNGGGTCVDVIEESELDTIIELNSQIIDATIAVTENPLSQFAATTSAQLAGVISDETGTGALVFGTSPTFTTSINTPKIANPGNITIDATNSVADSTITITNSDAIYNANVSVEGTISASNLSGTNTGDQTITLTGDVTGSGTGTFTTTIADAVVDGDNLAVSVAGRSLTLTAGIPDTLDADAELYTDVKTLYLENPTAADDLQTIWVAPLPLTITKIHCESDQTVVFDLLVDDGIPAPVNGTDITCSTFATTTGLAGDTTMAAGDRLDLAITSVLNTPTWVSISWEFIYDD